MKRALSVCAAAACLLAPAAAGAQDLGLETLIEARDQFFAGNCAAAQPTFRAFITRLDVAAVDELHNRRAGRQPPQQVSLAGEGAVLPAHIAVWREVFGAKHLKRDRLSGAPVGGGQHAGVMSQREGIHKVRKAVDILQ